MYASACNTMQVAIQRLAKVSRPAPAPIPQPSQPAKSSRPSQPNKRRRKVVAGGSTALAALFCFFIFSSPWTPGLQASHPHNLPASGHYKALQESDFSGSANSGRVLQAIHTDDLSNGGSPDHENTISSLSKMNE
jgi:hypothetical protein